LIEDVEYDDAESPAIGLVPAGVSWAAVRDHIKIVHGPLLVPGDGGYAGAWWTGTELAVTGDLGPDQDEAMGEFRQFLLDRGET
jgi:hypothetical protein